MRIGRNQVTNGCHAPMQAFECNRTCLNGLNTFGDVPRAPVSRIRYPRTTRATVLGFAPNAPPRLVRSVSETTTYRGMALGFPRYYFRFALREGLGNSLGVRKSCFLSWSWLAAGIGLVARLLVGVLEHLVAQVTGRIAAPAWTATAGTSSPASTPRPAADVAAAADGPSAAARAIPAADGLEYLDVRLSPLTDFGLRNQGPPTCGRISN